MQGKKDFMVLAGEFQSKVSTVRNDYQDILDGIEAAKKQKKKEKEKYNRCLDMGSESGMRECLRVIKRANEQIENLPGLRSKYYGYVGGFEC